MMRSLNPQLVAFVSDVERLAFEAVVTAPSNDEGSHLTEPKENKVEKVALRVRFMKEMSDGMKSNCRSLIWECEV